MPVEFLSDTEAGAYGRFSVNSERRGLWAYYYVRPDALKELSVWLS